MKSIAKDWLNADLFPLAVRMVLFGGFFANILDIEKPGDPTVGLNFQAGLKAGLVVLAGALGFLGVLRFEAVRRLLMTGVGVLAILLSFLYFATLPFSIDRTVSLVGAVSFTSYLLLILTGLVLIGPHKLLSDSALALFLFLASGWFCYLFIPELGTFVEQAGKDKILRMSGLTHPNSLGRTAGIFVLVFMAVRQERRALGLVWLAGIAFGLVTIWASLSRTSMAACLLSVMVLHYTWIGSRWFIAAASMAIFAGIIGLLYIDNQYGLDRVINEILVGSSKAGDAEEITSVTGRTEIWAETWSLVQERPFTGYGFGTSPLLLEDHSFYTHNIVLNPTLSFGYAGGIVVLIWLLVNLRWLILSDINAVKAISTYILVSGMTENTILGTYPESSTLVWLMVSFWPYLAFATRGDVSPRAAEATSAVTT
jgi:exopolysaccharide production protein ExoQ